MTVSIFNNYTGRSRSDKHFRYENNYIDLNWFITVSGKMEHQKILILFTSEIILNLA